MAVRFHFTGVVLLCCAVFFMMFFRDPERKVPSDESLVVSPADGKIIRIDSSEDSKGAPGYFRVSIFMSLFNVHVNRAPVHGTITGVSYMKGKFLPAFKEAAALFNEQNTLTISNPGGEIKVTQVAGVLARRIVCTRKRGDRVTRGERIGLIKFGSRVDLYLPPGVEILVEQGDRVKGGISGIARISGASGNHVPDRDR